MLEQIVCFAHEDKVVGGLALGWPGAMVGSWAGPSWEDAETVRRLGRQVIG